MNILDVISVVVFLLFLQMAVFVGLRFRSLKAFGWLVALCLLMSVWALSGLFPEKVPGEGARLLFSPFTIVGWGVLPALLVAFMTSLVHFPGKVLHRHGMALGFLLLGAAAVAAGLGGRLPLLMGLTQAGPGRVYAMMMGVHAGLLVLTLVAFLLRWKRQASGSDLYVSFDMLFLPLLLFLGMALFTDYVIPLLFHDRIWGMTPVYALFWAPFLYYSLRDFKNARVGPGQAAEVALDALPQPVILCTPEGRIYRVNPFLADKLGCRLEDLEGLPAGSLFRGALKKGPAGPEATAGELLSGPQETCLRHEGGPHLPVGFHRVEVRDVFHDFHGVALLGKDLKEVRLLSGRLRSIDADREVALQRNTRLEGILARCSEDLAGVYRNLQMRISESLRMEERIESELIERDVLVNEIHNRVIANMNLINGLILSRKEARFPESSRLKFDELARRVRAIYLVHEHLYLSVTYSEVDFKGFLLKLTQELMGFYGMQAVVRVDAGLSDEFLSIHQAIPAGLIMNELISNSLKHAWVKGAGRPPGRSSPRLSISTLKEGGHWSMEVRDNGRGLPEPLPEETMGLPLATILAEEQLSGTFAVRRCRPGTVFLLSFPGAGQVSETP